MRMGMALKLGTRVVAVGAYLTKDDILIILMIIISGLQLLYDYIKDRRG